MTVALHLTLFRSGCQICTLTFQFCSRKCFESRIGAGEISVPRSSKEAGASAKPAHLAQGHQPEYNSAKLEQVLVASECLTWFYLPSAAVNHVRLRIDASHSVALLCVDFHPGVIRDRVFFGLLIVNGLPLPIGVLRLQPYRIDWREPYPY